MCDILIDVVDKVQRRLWTSVIVNRSDNASPLSFFCLSLSSRALFMRLMNLCKCNLDFHSH